MNGSVFIRGLWGDTVQEAEEAETCTIHDTYRKLIEAWTEYEQPTPCINFSFGTHNSEFLKRHGIPRIELAREGIVNWSGMADRNPGSGGRVNWGLSFWRHKLECIRTALEFFQEVIWLDWDCHLLRKLQPGFWERIRLGQPWQAQLRRYARHHCPRGIIRGKQRILPHGGFLYFRDAEIVKELIKIHEETVPSCTDEVGMALLYRRLTGHWIEVEKWFRDGYAPFCYTTRKACKDPELLLFSEGLLEHDREAKLRIQMTNA